ncbi:MAG: hypothetical protein M4579_003810 [Chaenotheca gracillima]|nr:MAG: hypothetical protein M4579_003810 [Chaenotheca gracillima]
MPLASRLSNLFSDSTQKSASDDGTDSNAGQGVGDRGLAMSKPEIAIGYGEERTMPASASRDTEGRPPYVHSMLAGGLGGTTGDLLMHSLDTVKTRQQGDPHIPPKYGSMSSSYLKIFRQEGIRRGLYGGVFPAFLGSFPGTIIFFGTYEYSKRHLIDAGMNSHLAYLSSGFLADLAASVVYVPSEVLKTRLQLQGRFNNPFFNSGYNYRSTMDAAKTIVRQEGLSALFYGYRATLWRDLPFSALQFAFYEQNRKWAKQWVGNRDIGLPLEILTGAGAGGLAGVMTCPLDVVKTRIQTQLHPPANPAPTSKDASRKPMQTFPRPTGHQKGPHRPTRFISTSSPSTAVHKAGTVSLDTSSIYTGLKLIYQYEGIGGWFRGVGPRFVWTSVQSCTMLVLYQALLRQFELHSR